MDVLGFSPLWCGVEQLLAIAQPTAREISVV